MPRASTLLLLIAVSGVAHADDPEQRKVHFERGNQLATAGDHRGAVAEFQAAYAAAPHPNLLYNIGVEYQFLSHSPDDSPEVRLANARMAVTYFRRYLSEAPNPPNRAEAEAAIARLEEEQKAFRAPTEPVTTEPVPRPDITTPPPAHGVGTVRLALGLTGVTVGALMAVAGAVLWGIAVSDNSGANSAPTEGERDDRKATAANERAAGISLVAIGGAAVVAGALALSLPARGDRPVAVRVGVTPGGVMLSGNF